MLTEEKCEKCLVGFGEEVELWREREEGLEYGRDPV